MRKRPLAGRLGWLIAGLLATSATAQTPLDQALTLQRGMDAAARTSQQTIDRVADDTDKLLADYRLMTREAASLKRYNEQLDKQLAAQLGEMASIERQLERINDVAREVVPLMLRMIDTLAQFVSLDLPFLTAERTDRVTALRELMDRADVTTSEKYRRIVEAYQVEMEYGRTIEAYQGELALDGGSKVVDFLRIGRIALLWQTLDGRQSGWFDPASRQFQPLEGTTRAVRDGLRIARKQIAPDLLIVPVAAPAQP